MGTDEELQSLRRQLKTHKKNIFKLKEKAATYGIDVPLYLSNQIDHEKEEIAHIEKQIAQLKETRSSFTKVFEAAGPVRAVRQLVEATKMPGIEAKHYGCHTPGQDDNIKLYIEGVDVGLVRLKFIDSEQKTQGIISAELKAAQMGLVEDWYDKLLGLLTQARRFPSARSGILEGTESKKERPTIVSESHSLSQYDYDVALSFAGEDRGYVEKVAEILKKRHVRVFYDKFEETDLWGKDLYVHLDEVYRLKARYCVMFISKHYASKLWTNHERRSAQARAFQENEEYLLPARFDDTEIPGIRPTVGYVDLRTTSPSQLAEKIIAKLEQSASPVTRSSQPVDRLREPPPSVLYPASDLPTITIDVRHGARIDPLVRELDVHGFRTKELSAPLTVNSLSDVSVLTLFIAYPNHSRQPLTTEEITTIQSFVVYGGGLFLIGLGWVWKDYGKKLGLTMDDYPLNKISYPQFGIYFRGEYLNDPESEFEMIGGYPCAKFDSTSMREHPITAGVRKISSFGMSSTLEVISPSIPLVWDGNNQDRCVLAAWHMQGQGRVVCLQHEGYFKDDYIHELDNLKLLINIVRWLSQPG